MSGSFTRTGRRFFVRRGRFELRGAINPQDALVVPKVSFQAHPVVAFPEAPASMPGDDFVEPVDERRVMRGLIAGLMVIARSPQVHGTAGA